MRDYRTRLKEQNIDVEGYLGLGAAEPTVARFSGRLRRLGRSWSSRGALAMAHAIAGQGQGRLRRAVLTMEQQSGLEKMAKRITQTAKIISGDCVFDRSIPILDTGRKASGGLSHALRGMIGGTMHPRFI
nr:hypothetical protein PROKKA_PARTIAL_00045 [uncultured bacterium]